MLWERWQRWNQWTLTELPVLNRAIIGRRRPARDLAVQARASVLAEMPDPEEYSPQEAQRVLVLLGLLGASAARHYQEADIERKTRPQESFGGFEVGARGVPFRSYFAAVADASGTGHAGRDCYASIVRWNVPTAEVLVGGRVVAVLPGVFPDAEIRTYTGDPGEVAFLELLKTSEALGAGGQRRVGADRGRVDRRLVGRGRRAGIGGHPVPDGARRGQPGLRRDGAG